MTSGLIPDDGFREIITSNSEQLRDPRILGTAEKPVPLMLNKQNFDEQRKICRPASGVSRGFGAVLPQHEHTHEQRYFASEYSTFYGRRPTTATVKNHQAGTNPRPLEVQGTRIISNLVGEVYNKEHDPQEKTDVQRTWLSV